MYWPEAKNVYVKNKDEMPPLIRTAMLGLLPWQDSLPGSKGHSDLLSRCWSVLVVFFFFPSWFLHLSFLSRDWTQASTVKVLSHNHWTAEKSQILNCVFGNSDGMGPCQVWPLFWQDTKLCWKPCFYRAGPESHSEAFSWATALSSV